MSNGSNRRQNRSAGPTRTQSDLADVVELLLDKGIVINADIAVSVGDAELLGIQLRAAIASFETAAKYGLEFPTGTDTDRIEEIADATSVEADDEAEERDREIGCSAVGEQFMGLHEPPISESSPAMESAPITEPDDEDERADEETDDDGGDGSGLTEAVEGAGDAVSGSDNDAYGSRSEPGVRERPTAPDASEASDTSDGSGGDTDENDGNNGSDGNDESSADTDDTDTDTNADGTERDEE